MTYTLIQNHLQPNTPFYGCLFNIDGEELQFIQHQPEDRVWTTIDCDGQMRVQAGYHWVNRTGYFLSQESWTDPGECYDIDDFFLE